MPRNPDHVKRRLTKYQLKEIELIILAKMERSKGKYFDHTDLRYLKKEAAQYVLQGGRSFHDAVELAMTDTYKTS